METKRGIQNRLVPIIVLCSVFGGVVVGVGVVSSTGVSGVSGAHAQTDRLHTLSENESPPASDTVEQIAIDSVTMKTAPGDRFNATDENVSKLTTETETVAAGDVVVVEITSENLSNELAPRSGRDDPTARLLALIQSGGVDVQFRLSNETLDLFAINETGGLRVVSGVEESTISILVDTERAVFDNGTTGVEPTGSDELDLGVVVDGHGAGEPISKHVTITPRLASFETNENDTIHLSADSNQTITGTTTVAPETMFTVSVKSEDDAAFVITDTVRVREDRTFGLTLDFGNVTKGVKFTVSVPGEGFHANASTAGKLGASATASITLQPQRLGPDLNQTITVRSATLSDGGFLVVYNRSYLTKNRSAATESYRGSIQLEPGSHENVSIPLTTAYLGQGTVIVVPHLDTNDNGEFDHENSSIDRPYRGADGKPVIGVASVSVNDSSVTVEQNKSTNASANPQEVDTEQGDSHESTTTTTTTDIGSATPVPLTEVNGPGFGPLSGLVAVAITALLVIMGRRG